MKKVCIGTIISNLSLASVAYKKRVAGRDNLYRVEGMWREAELGEGRALPISYTLFLYKQLDAAVSPKN